MDYLDRINWLSGSVGFLINVVFLLGLTRFIMGPRLQGDSKEGHPFFGRYTIYVPNAMSFLRLPIGAWIFIVIQFDVFHNVFGFYSLHLAFWVVTFFDSLDGMFARKWNAITEEGKSLDPLADKAVTFILAMTAYFFGELRGREWVLIILFGREIGSMILRYRLQKKGKDVSAKWLGKLKTIAQFTILYVLISRIEIYLI
ncbi:MAG: CDP-alcohol phosphatidyltransferase family protein [Chlamydiota bacterium]|nr:CDP-alcohol phosphatidyltransferase family protein [Chlamydiota bacterium]